MSRRPPFNSLCVVCKNVFANVRKDRESHFSWFHDVAGLLSSAAAGCHFCTIVLDRVAVRDLNLLKAELDDFHTANMGVKRKQLKMKQLNSETRYYKGVGVSFILRRRHAEQRDVLAAVEFSLDAAPGKQD